MQPKISQGGAGTRTRPRQPGIAVNERVTRSGRAATGRGEPHGRFPRSCCSPLALLAELNRPQKNLPHERFTYSPASAVPPPAGAVPAGSAQRLPPAALLILCPSSPRLAGSSPRGHPQGCAADGKGSGRKLQLRSRRRCGSGWLRRRFPAPGTKAAPRQPCFSTSLRT